MKGGKACPESKCDLFCQVSGGLEVRPFRRQPAQENKIWCGTSIAHFSSLMQTDFELFRVQSLMVEVHKIICHIPKSASTKRVQSVQWSDELLPKRAVQLLLGSLCSFCSKCATGSQSNTGSFYRVNIVDLTDADIAATNGEIQHALCISTTVGTGSKGRPGAPATVFDLDTTSKHDNHGSTVRLLKSKGKHCNSIAIAAISDCYRLNRWDRLQMQSLWPQLQ